MIYIFLGLMIIIIACFFHFEPMLEQESDGIYILSYNTDRQTKERKSIQISLDNILDNLGTTMLSFFIFLFGIYFSGILLFLIGIQEEEEETIISGLIVSSLNILMIWLTFKFIGV